VLAFLEQLKNYDNLSFVLTGGLASSRQIDFAKLCDHIEYLKLIQVEHSSALVGRLLKGCLDTTVFPHEPLGDANRQHLWSQLSGRFLQDIEELSLPQAVASLLNTPRSVRHALGRTLTAWQTLFGEIDLIHLLAVNVLRFAAPECFDFLMRQWDRLHSPPTQHLTFGEERTEEIRQGIVEDWKKTIQNVEWNPKAALKVVQVILPATEYWLGDSCRLGHSDDTSQGVKGERYWLRAVNEAIDQDGVPDQKVVRDMRRWLESPNADAKLITGLTSSSRYSNVWEDLAGNILTSQLETILLICEHVLTRISRKLGSAASADSQGFASTWRFANRRVVGRPENREWLQARIAEASTVSIELVNSLWHYYGTSGKYSILRPEDHDAVRLYEIQTLQSALLDGETLGRVINVQHPYVLYQLVFDPGDHNPERIADIPAWTWMGPIVLDALRREDVAVAAGVTNLVATHQSGSRRDPLTVDPDVLFEFFPNEAPEVIDLLSGLSSQVEDPEQQQSISAIVESARIAIQERNSGTEGGETDAS